MVSVNFIDVKEIAPELGVYFIVSVIIYFAYMGKIRGKLQFIEVFIASRDWDFLNSSEDLEKYLGILKFIMVSILMSPVFSLLIWVGTLLYVEGTEGEEYETRVGISTFFVCAGFILTMSGVENMRWEHYRMSRNTILLISFGTLSYTVFLFVVVFMQNEIDFIGISAMFISGNGIFVFIILFFTQNKATVTVDKVLDKLKSNEEITKEIEELYTIPKVTYERRTSAVSGGIQAMFTNASYAKRREIVCFAFYICALGMLIAYSVIAHENSSYPSMGILNSFLILSVDLLVFFFIYAQILSSAGNSVLLSLLARFFIFILTGDNWFIGYSCVYWVFSIYAVNHLIDRNFPLLNTIKDLVTETKDIGKTVEFTYFSVLLVYVCLILAITLGEPDGIPYTSFSVQGYEIPLWLIGICSVLISLVFACLAICFRLMKRRIHGIRDTVEYYLFFRGFGLFWMFGSFGLIICWASAIAIYLSASSTVLIVMLSILPLVILLNMSLYANWAKNDYSIVKDPRQFNVYIKKTKQIEEEIIEKVKKFQEDFLERSEHLADSSFMNKTVNESFSKNLSKRSINPREALRNRHGLIDPEKLREKIPEPMYDWTAEMSVFKAFILGKLLRSDYINIFQRFFSMLLNCVMAGIIFGVDRQMKYGVTSAVMILSLNCVLYPLQHNLYTSIPLSWTSHLSIAFGGLLNFGYGYIYYHFELGQNSNSKKNGINVFFNTFVLPVVISYGYAIYKLRADDWKFNRYSLVMLVLAQVFGVGGAVVIILIDTGAGIALFGFFFIIGLYVAIFVKYSHDGYKMSACLKWVFAVFTCLIALSGVAIGIAVSNLGVYAGFSITYLFCAVVFICYSLVNIYKNLKKNTTTPVFFSTWVFPIYRYNPARQCVINADEMGIHVLIGLNLVLIWSITCVIWMKPTSIGVSVACLSEVLIILVYIFLSLITSTQLEDALKLLNPDENLKTLKKAWIESRSKMLERLGASNYEDFPSYFERSQKLIELFEMIKQKSFALPQSPNPAWKRLHTEMKDLRDFLTEYYIEDTRNNDQYILELELAIHFQLLVTLSAFSSKTTEVLLHNNLVSSKSVELKAFGIIFTLNKGGKTLLEKYTHITQEISKLNHIQRKNFEDIKERFEIELEEQRIKRKQQEAEEKKAIEARMQELKALHEKRQEKLKNQTSDLPIEEMVDSPEKFKKIIETCKQKGLKFEDSQFPPNESVLGFTAKNTAGWKRAENCTVFEGGVSPSDVKQGAIGDCYYLSAISVLGEKRIKDIFEDYSQEHGAYLLKFYKYGDPVHVIVDDYFPINSEQHWAFAQTVSGTELWPMLLEKAYAKLNGGFQNIVAGKVHFALSDLTGGQPEEVKLEPMQNNPEALWAKLQSYKSSNYPMGAGSPENPQGDTAVSQNGIVQGHAYSVLDAQEVAGEKVVKLKNPHGQHGQEWRGDWSDGSSKWTKQATLKLAYEDKPDGIFWMSLEDFVWEYKNLYVCRIFDDLNKWKKLEVSGEWAGKKAAGFPCKENPQARIEDNPQFWLKVSKDSLAFVTLTQKNSLDMFKGKCPILFLVFVGGKRVSDITKGMVGSSGKPIDLRIVGNEVVLNKGNTYTILVTSMYQGERGAGGFELNVTVDDLKATIGEIS